MKIRRATVSDGKDIQRLIGGYAERGEMLPRSLSDIYENLRDYHVCVDDGNRLVGVSALHVMWDDLAEIRSLAVVPEYSGRGIGANLVKACIEDGAGLGIRRIFALTYRPDYFKRFGFNEVDKADLPQKIWTDCLKCTKFPDCDEIAVILELVDEGVFSEERGG